VLLETGILSEHQAYKFFHIIFLSDFSGFIAGFSADNLIVKRGNHLIHHSVLLEEYSCPHWAPFYRGIVYAIPMPTLHLLSTLQRAFEPIYIEDGLVGVLARLGHVKRIDLPLNQFLKVCRDSFGKFFKFCWVLLKIK